MVPGGPASVQECPSYLLQRGDAGLRHLGKEVPTWAVAEGLGMGCVVLCPKGGEGQTGSLGLSGCISHSVSQT